MRLPCELSPGFRLNAKARESTVSRKYPGAHRKATLPQSPVVATRKPRGSAELDLGANLCHVISWRLPKYIDRKSAIFLILGEALFHFSSIFDSYGCPAPRAQSILKCNLACVRDTVAELLVILSTSFREQAKTRKHLR